MRVACPRAVACAGVALLTLLPGAADVSAAPAGARGAVADRIGEPVAGRVLRFEPNVGQTDGEVEYVARCRGYVAFLTATGFVARTESLSLRVGFAAASARRGVAAEPLPGVSNYLVGDERSAWVRGVPHSARVVYRDVWPGVDASYRGDRCLLAADFVVAAGDHTYPVPI